MTTAVFVGDSFVAAPGSYCYAAGSRLGWTVSTGTDGWAYIGETPPASAYETVQLGLLEASPPDVIVMAGGFHDVWNLDPADVRAAVRRAFARLAALPSRVIVQHPSVGSAGGQYGPAYVAPVVAMLRDEAAGRGWAFVDFTGWLTGTGYQGHEQGDGNSDLYVGPDGLHPTAAGHAYLGARFAYALGADRIAGVDASAGVPLMLEVPA